MDIFMWYILGALLAGFIFILLTQHVDSFYNLICHHIDQSKDELKNDGNINDTERILLDGISNDSIIDYMAWFLTLLSWVGVLLIAFYILVWMCDPNDKE